jgi:hypothetical protein
LLRTERGTFAADGFRGRDLASACEARREKEREIRIPLFRKRLPRRVLEELRVSAPCGDEHGRLAGPSFALQRLNHRVTRLLRNEKKFRSERRNGEARRKRREKEGAAGKCGA